MSRLSLVSAIVDGAFVLPDEFEMGSWQGRPLVWRVVKLEGASALVVTRSVICSRPFSQATSNASWDACDLRLWLNGEFYDEAFEEEEAAAVVNRKLANPGSSEYGTSGCDPTMDKVFCLSVEEAQKLFATDDIRCAEGENPSWWLRSPGGCEGFAAYVYLNGWINEYGADACDQGVSVRPAMAIDLRCVDLEMQDGSRVQAGSGDSFVLASEAGMELMLEATDDGDYSNAAAFAARFGMDASWESLVVERLEQCAEQGDASAIEDLFTMFGGIEFGSSALAGAMAEGNLSVVRALMRKGFSLDGACKKVALVNDTPGLRRQRRDEYGAGKTHAPVALSGFESEGAVKLLIRQDSLPASEYRLLLRAAAANKEAQDLFEWMLNPDYDPLPGVGARWGSRKVMVVSRKAKSDLPISKKAIRLLWHGGMAKDDPQSVKAMVPYLADPSIVDRQDLLNLIIKEGWNQEFHTLLSVKRMFTPNMLVEGLSLARQVGRKDMAKELVTLIKSIGAGSRLQSDE